MLFFQDNPQNLFIPQIFLNSFDYKQESLLSSQKITFVTFTIGELLPLAYTVENEHKNNVVFCNDLAQKSDAHIIAVKKQELRFLKNKYLAIKTADCLPVVFSYEDEIFFLGGVTHAGWRGLTTNIVSNTIHKLFASAQNLKIELEKFKNNLKVFLAPAIFGVTYECGADVKVALEKYQKTFSFSEKSQLAPLFNVCANVRINPFLSLKIDEFAEKFNRVLQPHSLFPDLQLLAVLECMHLGLKPENISIYRENTYGHLKFPSFRQATHNGLKNPHPIWTYLCLPSNI